MENRSAHEEYYADKFSKRPQHRVDLGLHSLRHQALQDEEATYSLMERDGEKLRVARSDIIPTEAVKQVFELLQAPAIPRAALFLPQANRSMFRPVAESCNNCAGVLVQWVGS